MFEDLVIKNRSIRRFDEKVKVPYQTLVELVDLARQSPSSANLQALKFYLASEPPQTNQIFSSLKFASYLTEWAGPTEGERPAAYILILGDRRIKRQFDFDAGIAAQTIMLGAAERGLGGCILASVHRDWLSEQLDLADDFEIIVALALGKPDEKVVIEAVTPEHGIKYYRDPQGVHHVPKRSLDELIIS